MSRTTRELRTELEELAQVIRVTEEAADEARDRFAWDLTLSGLRSRQEHLVAIAEALYAEQRVAQLDLHFEGDPVSRGAVEIGFLGRFLDSTQKLLSAIGQAESSTPTTRGTIPDSIIERTRLRLASVGVGSFSATLVGEASPNLFGESLIQECLDRLQALAQAGDSVAALADLLSRLGGRVQGHYASFLDGLQSANASVSLVTWLDASTPRAVTITRSQAQNTMEALGMLQREEEYLEEHTGQLIGLMQHRAQFEFKDAVSGLVLSGKVLPVALGKASNCYNLDVRASFSVEVTRIEGRDNTRESLTLVDVHRLDGQAASLEDLLPPV